MNQVSKAKEEEEQSHRGGGGLQGGLAVAFLH